jgi:hypothetical protein
MDRRGDEQNDDELDLLLAGGRLRGPAAERLRARVLDQSAAAPPRRRGARLAISAVLVLGAAAVLPLMVAQREPGPPSGTRAKGAGDSAATATPLIAEVACTGAASAARLGTCPTGSRVSIAISGAPTGGYVGAYAEPVAGGPRIWYFSSEDGPAALSESEGETRLASRSIVLGSEQPPGRYRVHVVLSSRPLGREEILDRGAAGAISRTVLPLDVVAAAPAPAREAP